MSTEAQIPADDERPNTVEEMIAALLILSLIEDRDGECLDALERLWPRINWALFIQRFCEESSLSNPFAQFPAIPHHDHPANDAAPQPALP